MNRPNIVPVSASKKWIRRAKKISLGTAVVSIFPELLFCIVPLLVLSLSLLFVGKGIMTLLASPEWSFASAILLGQSLVRFVIGTTSSKRARQRVVAFIVSSIIVLELIPALAVLSFTIITHEKLGAEQVPGWLIGLQLLLFAMSLITFVTIGGIGEAITEEEVTEEG